MRDSSVAWTNFARRLAVTDFNQSMIDISARRKRRVAIDFAGRDPDSLRSRHLDPLGRRPGPGHGHDRDL